MDRKTTELMIENKTRPQRIHLARKFRHLPKSHGSPFRGLAATAQNFQNRYKLPLTRLAIGKPRPSVSRDLPP